MGGPAQDCNLALYNANYLPAAGGKPVPANLVYSTGTSGKGTPLCSARVSSASGGSLTVVDANGTVQFRAPASPVTPAPIDTIPSGGTLAQSLNLYSLNALYYLVPQVRSTHILRVAPIVCIITTALVRACLCISMLAALAAQASAVHAALCACSWAGLACNECSMLMANDGGCQGDGNLVFYSLASGSRTVAWASGTYGISTHSPFRLQMQTVRGEVGGSLPCAILNHRLSILQEQMVALSGSHLPVQLSARALCTQ